jgi:hypothetical protein
MRIGAKPIHLLHTLGQFILLTARSMHIATSLLGCATNDDGIGTTVADRDIADPAHGPNSLGSTPSPARRDAGTEPSTAAPDSASAARSPELPCDNKHDEVQDACEALCMTLADMQCGDVVTRLELALPPIYWWSVVFLNESPSHCEQTCMQGADPVAQTLSLAPARCGTELLRLLQCMVDTIRCSETDAGTPGLVAFDCDRQAARLIECGPTCNALPTCSQQTCFGESFSGDVGCTNHCGGYEDRFCVTGFNACSAD